MKQKTKKFYAVLFEYPNLKWVWSTNNKWEAYFECTPKPLAHSTAIRKARKEMKEDKYIYKTTVISEDEYEKLLNSISG